MTNRTGASSLAQRAYARLRADILEGRLRPGQRLRPAGLAAAQGVSVSVVREVLNRLAGERLVRATPQQGFTVVQATAADLVDLFDVLALVETAALREAVERGTLEWESGVVAAHHRLARTPVPGPDGPGDGADEWARAHDAFHAATMAACGSPRLLETITGLVQCAALYRRWTHPHGEEGRNVAAEHRAIFEAAVGRDADLACRLHQEHVRRTVDGALAALEHENAAATGGPGPEPGTRAPAPEGP
ncbi:GntR family transcriptional regulator [Nocardiopsis flavescens]|uniref:GntR family transcriptional regulator n=1 Tax=Nocardiopsis flavescens TaxID=758803 RepID=UPI00365136C3